MCEASPLTCAHVYVREAATIAFFGLFIFSEQEVPYQMERILQVALHLGT